jgi:hypothetical protein
MSYASLAVAAGPKAVPLCSGRRLEIHLVLRRNRLLRRTASRVVQLDAGVAYEIHTWGSLGFVDSRLWGRNSVTRRRLGCGHRFWGGTRSGQLVNLVRRLRRWNRGRPGWLGELVHRQAQPNLADVF